MRLFAAIALLILGANFATAQGLTPLTQQEARIVELRLGGTTNIISDNGTNLTRNGQLIAGTGGSGGSQSPWTNDVDAAGQDLTGTAYLSSTNGQFVGLTTTTFRVLGAATVDGNTVLNGTLTVNRETYFVTVINVSTTVVMGTTTSFVNQTVYSTQIVYQTTIINTSAVIYTTNLVTTYVNIGGTFDATNAVYVALPNLHLQGDDATATGNWSFTAATVDFTGATVVGLGGGTVTNARSTTNWLSASVIDGEVVVGEGVVAPLLEESFTINGVAVTKGSEFNLVADGTGIVGVSISPARVDAGATNGGVVSLTYDASRLFTTSHVSGIDVEINLPSKQKNVSYRDTGSTKSTNYMMEVVGPMNAWSQIFAVFRNPTNALGAYSNKVMAVLSGGPFDDFNAASGQTWRGSLTLSPTAFAGGGGFDYTPIGEGDGNQGVVALTLAYGYRNSGFNISALPYTVSESVTPTAGRSFIIGEWDDLNSEYYVKINENSYDIDFTVESDSRAFALHVNGGSNNVGVNTGTPTTGLDVNENILVRSNFVQRHSYTIPVAAATNEVVMRWVHYGDSNVLYAASSLGTNAIAVNP